MQSYEGHLDRLYAEADAAPLPGALSPAYMPLQVTHPTQHASAISGQHAAPKVPGPAEVIVPSSAAEASTVRPPVGEHGWRVVGGIVASSSATAVVVNGATASGGLSNAAQQADVQNEADEEGEAIFESIIASLTLVPATCNASATHALASGQDAAAADVAINTGLPAALPCGQPADGPTFEQPLQHEVSLQSQLHHNVDDDEPVMVPCHVHPLSGRPDRDVQITSVRAARALRGGKGAATAGPGETSEKLDAWQAMSMQPVTSLHLPLNGSAIRSLIDMAGRQAFGGDVTTGDGWCWINSVAQLHGLALNGGSVDAHSLQRMEKKHAKGLRRELSKWLWSEDAIEAGALQVFTANWQDELRVGVGRYMQLFEELRLMQGPSRDTLRLHAYASAIAAPPTAGKQ